MCLNRPNVTASRHPEHETGLRLLHFRDKKDRVTKTVFHWATQNHNKTVIAQHFAPHHIAALTFSTAVVDWQAMLKIKAHTALPALVALLAFFIFLPDWLAQFVPHSDSGEYATFVASTRQAVAQLLGSIVTAFGVLIALQTYIASRTKTVAEVLAKAGELLRENAPYARLAGIFTLRRLALDNAGDATRCVAILDSYLQQHCPKPLSPNVPRDRPVGYFGQKDVEAALSVVSEVVKAHKMVDEVPDLSNVAIGGSWCIDLTFNGAYLDNSEFYRCDFTGTHFDNARCIDAVFTECNLSNVSFRGATLRGTQFPKSDLRGAIFTKADLKSADLSSAQNLTLAQIADALTDKTTRLPPVEKTI